MIRILIVDDSAFICKRIREILQEDPDMQVVGIASNGAEAVRLVATLKPDVITMDVEMPVMDGITAVKKIMESAPTPILMFSASTHAGAQATLDALNAGAVDFLPKRLEEINGDRELAKQFLRRRVRMVALHAVNVRTSPMQHEAVPATMPKPAIGTTARSLLTRRIQLLVLVASTGGPVAIQRLLTQIPPRCAFPVLIVQHMPPRFTQIFAERLNDLCPITVREAREGDTLQPAVALVGPGGMQMELNSVAGRKSIALRPKHADELYSPCADITLASVAQHYPRDTLAVILTGMGADGKEGAMRLKQQGSLVWAQNEASCTIYGMPKAVVDAHLADQVLSLDALAEEFRKFV